MIRATMGIVCAAGYSLGCQVTLAVRPVAPAVPASVETECPATTPPDVCIASQRPSRHVEVRGAAVVHWARLSDDGKLLVASIGTQPPGSGEASLVAAFDLDSEREIWRIELAEGGRIRADDCFLLPSGVALVIPEADGVPQTVVVLDRRTGVLKWRRSATPQGGSDADGTGLTSPSAIEAASAESVIEAVSADEQNDFVVTAESRTVNVLDGATGKVVASVDASHPAGKSAPRVHWTSMAAYVVDSGLTRIPRTDPKRIWRRRFATNAQDSHSAAAAAAAAAAVSGVALLLLSLPRGYPIVGLGLSPEETDYELGRTSDPVEVDGLACLGSLGIVSCFDSASGALVWSRRFPVTQFRVLATRPGTLCSLAGGFYVHQKGSLRELSESTFRALYCLRPSDGLPLTGFATHLSTNELGLLLTKDALESYDSSADDAALVAHGVPSGQPLLRALAPVDRGMLVAHGHMVQLVLTPNGTEPPPTNLRDLGEVTQLASAGDTVVASASGGFAGFDVASGALRWKTSFSVGRWPAIEFSSHDPKGLVRTSPSFGHRIEAEDAERLDAGMYWLLPETRSLVASGADGRLAGISIEDGSTRWQLTTNGQVAIDGSPSSPSLVVVHAADIRVYKVPGVIPSAAPSDHSSGR